MIGSIYYLSPPFSIFPDLRPPGVDRDKNFTPAYLPDGGGCCRRSEPVLPAPDRMRPAATAPGRHNLRKIRVPLVPPKPNELDKTTSIFISRAVWGT